MAPFRLAIVNAQCLGEDARTDSAIVHAFERGIITTASVRYQSPTATEAFELARCARQNPATRLTGRVLTDTEIEVIQRQSETETGLPLGLMLDLDSRTTSANTSTSTSTRKKPAKRQFSLGNTDSRLSTSSSSSTVITPALMEQLVRQQVSWFESHAGFAPHFIHSRNQHHLVSPQCDVLARIALSLGVQWVTCVEPIHGHCTLAASRTAKFIFASHSNQSLLHCDYELRWTSSLMLAEKSFISHSLTELRTGLTGIEVVFNDMKENDDFAEFQLSLIECCDQQQIVLTSPRDYQSVVLSTLQDTDDAPSLWPSLPSSLLHAIHSFLSAESFIIARRTCRDWRYESNKPGRQWDRLVFHVHPSLSNSSLYLIANRRLPITRLRVENKIMDCSVNELQYLTMLPSLTSVTITQSTRLNEALKLFPRTFQSLPTLRKLMLADNGLTDASVSMLGNLLRLEHLDVSENCLTIDGIEALVRNVRWPRLATLIAGNQVAVNDSDNHSGAVSDRSDSGNSEYDEQVTLVHAMIDTIFSTDQLPAIRAVHLSFGSRYREPSGGFSDSYLRYVEAVHRFGSLCPNVKLVSTLAR